MRASSLVWLLAFGALGCAAGPADDVTDPRSESDDEVQAGRDGGALKRDAGKSTTTTSSGGNSASGDTTVTVRTGKDGGVPVASGTVSGQNPLGGLGAIFSGGATDGGKTAPASSKDGGVDQCANAVCFDVFDCAIFHPDALDCGFTACVGFVCQ
jgi:hypothetical protein